MQFVNENTGFLCGYNGEFAKTINGGISWEEMPFGSTYSLTDMSFVDENHGWLINYEAKEILRTSNGGNSWTSSQLGSTIIYQPTCIFFIDHNEGFACTDDGLLYKTTDGGDSWQVIYGFAITNNAKIHFINSSEGFISDGFRMHHTYDGGLSWADGEYLGSYIRSLYFLDNDEAWLGGSNGLVAKYDGTVGFQEIHLSDEELFLFPNPAIKILHVNMPEELRIENSISVYDMEGKLLLNLFSEEDHGRLSIDISSLATGTYLLKVSNGDRQYQAKFIKH